jgi:hypothetical protein
MYKKRIEIGEEAWAEYQRLRKNKKSLKSIKRKKSLNVMSWRRKVKLKLIVYKGGKCERCGYDKIIFLGCFHFHHKDKDQKDFVISGKSCKFETLIKEADKCLLLCSNCHAETHAIENEQKSKDNNEYVDLIKNLNLKIEKIDEEIGIIRLGGYIKKLSSLLSLF